MGLRRRQAGRAPADDVVVEGGGVGGRHADDGHPVAVASDVLGGGVPAHQSGGEHQVDFPMLQQQRTLIRQPGLRPALTADAESKRGAHEVGRLTGIADVKL